MTPTTKIRLKHYFKVSPPRGIEGAIVADEDNAYVIEQWWEHDGGGGGWFPIPVEQAD